MAVLSPPKMSTCKSKEREREYRSINRGEKKKQDRLSGCTNRVVQQRGELLQVDAASRRDVVVLEAAAVGVPGSDVTSQPQSLGRWLRIGVGVPAALARPLETWLGRVSVEAGFGHAAVIDDAILRWIWAGGNEERIER